MIHRLDPTVSNARVALEGMLQQTSVHLRQQLEKGLETGQKAIETGQAKLNELTDQVADRLANFRRASAFRWTKERPLVERLAALYYWVQIFTGIWGYLLCFWLTYRFTWRFLIFFVPYLAYIFGPGLRSAQEGDWPTPMRSFFVWRLLARYFQAELHKTADLDPNKAYLFGYHPHGVMPVSAWLTFATWATGFDRLFPGVEPHITTLLFNFHGPILREYLLAHGVCGVNRRTCIHMLNKKKSIAIAIGGGSESLYTAPGTHEIILNRRKGFVKVALLTGASLVPVYLFGETDVYMTLNHYLPFDSAVRRFQRKMEKAWGWTWPVAWGTGVWLPLGVLPYPAVLHTVVGAPIDVPKFEGDEDSAEFRALVDKYHGLYKDALVKLFNEHREQYVPGEGPLTIME